MWARSLSYVAVGFFALAFVSVLGWPRIMSHQFALGALGAIVFFWLSLWLLRFLPLGEDDARD